MSILSIVNRVQDKLGEKRSNALVSSTNTGDRQWLALAREVCVDLVEACPWPALEKVASFTLVDGQASYALPSDYDRQITETHWDRSNQWELLGPVSPSDWRQLKDGITSTGPRLKFRVTGMTDNQLFIHPTPDSGSAGNIVGFEYYSTNIIRPRTWAQGNAYMNGSYTFYNGNIYYAATGGTAGATAPVHTSGLASDDNISWEYKLIKYDSFLADTDEVVIDEQLIEKGLEYMWLKQKGLSHTTEYQVYISAMMRKWNKLQGSRPLNHRGNPTFSFRLLNSQDAPDSGFGV